jgi:hypothetical protein
MIHPVAENNLFGCARANMKILDVLIRRRSYETTILGRRLTRI